MKNWYLIPLALVTGILVGAWGPRAELRARERQQEEEKAKPRQNGDGFASFTQMVNIPDQARRPRRPGQKDGRYMHLFCGMPSCTENEQNEKRPLVFNDKTEERLLILENKISVLEKWLKDFSEGAFSPFEPPEQAVSSEMVSSESAGSSMPAGKTVTADAAASAASEVSVSGESSSVINGTSAAVTEDDGGHDAPPGTVS